MSSIYQSDNSTIELHCTLYNGRAPLMTDGKGNLIKSEIPSSEENSKAWILFQQLVLTDNKSSVIEQAFKHDCSAYFSPEETMLVPLTERKISFLKAWNSCYWYHITHTITPNRGNSWSCNNLSSGIQHRLLEEAQFARIHSSVQSLNNYRGAAILTAKGDVFTGCEIENTDGTSFIHAEAAAISQFVQKHVIGDIVTDTMVAMAIISHNVTTCYAAILSILHKHGPDMIVITSACGGDKQKTCKLSEL
jgi:cytidine deaminase